MQYNLTVSAMADRKINVNLNVWLSYDLISQSSSELLTFTILFPDLKIKWQKYIVFNLL